ncbi:MAG TPA: diaminopimelate epimerase [Ignavibacteriales bacterium]|nr:diaminopimelate epimerase [Ignavibacteriales bacterium]
MKKVSFVKMSGAGNDFILFDKKITPELQLNSEAIEKMCSRRTGIGADGVLVIDDQEGLNFTMEYFNADGSTGTLCGNGARCALRYADYSGRIPSREAKFTSNGNSYSGEILGPDYVKFNFGTPCDYRPLMSLKAQGQQIMASYINTGSPHVVIKSDDVLKPGNSKEVFSDLGELPVFSLGREIRYLSDFAPGGTNVNFIKISGGKVYIRTYERGVEDETWACGTGSVASALVCFLKGELKSPVLLVTKGGDELKVEFKADGENIRDLSLSGPAVITFTGEFYKNLYF